RLMRKGLYYYALLISVVMALLVFGCSPAEERELVFFYETICASCIDTEETQRLLTRVMEVRRRNEAVSGEIHNVNREAGRDALEVVAAEYGLRVDSIRLPALFVKEGKAYQGNELIDAYLSELE
ncbi:MAG: hypothetical protein KGZ25_10995, partial [Planctomycetes bacterium]|nr:hypothetical protein [Planctomycetota bacterium]